MKRVKKLHLLTMALAAALLFAYMPITANAASITGQGGLVGDDNPGAGDTLDVGGGATPAATPAGTATPAAPETPVDPETPDTPEEPEAPVDPVSPEQLDENGVPLDGGQGQGQDETSDLGDGDVPLASTMAPTQGSVFSWWGFLLGVATGAVVVGGIWLIASKSKKDSETK